MKQSFLCCLRIIALIGMSICALVGLAEKWVEVTYDGTQCLYINLSEDPTVRILRDEIEVSGIDSPFSLLLAESPEFRITSESAVNEIKSGKIANVVRKDNVLFISNLIPHSRIDVFDPAGNHLASYTVDDNGQSVVDLSVLTNGIYLLTNESLTIKILK